MDALGEAGAVARGHARSLLSHCHNGAAHTADDGHGGSAGVGMRFFAWTVNLLLAVTLLIAAVRTWPPPVRVFPRRKPLLGVPWCVMARVLGYGVFDWRTGKLAPWWDFLKEKHEILNIFAGDAGFITQRGRFTHLATELACTAAVSMVLTDLTSARVTGDFWTEQLWVFVLLMTYDIVLGIALRLATLGATKASFEAAENVGFMCAENGDLENLEDENQLIDMGVKASRAFNSIQYHMAQILMGFSCLNLMVCALWAHLANPADGCGNAMNTFLGYMYVFGVYQGFSLVVVSPFMLTVRWCFGAFLITRIPEVETAEETMDCCWKNACPRLCGCKPPLVTPRTQRTVSNLFVSPRKQSGVMTGNLVEAAAVAGRTRYDQESPMTPQMPAAMNRDASDGVDLFGASFKGKDVEVGTPIDGDVEDDEPTTPMSPTQKYASLRRQASLRTSVNPEHFDYKQYPDGNMDHRPRYDLGNDDQIAGDSAYAAARMALMSAGKLTPEQVIRTSDYTADWSAFAERYATSPRHDDTPKPSSKAAEAANRGKDYDDDDDDDDDVVRSDFHFPDADDEDAPAELDVSWRRKLEQSIDHETSDVERDDELDDELDDDPWGDGTA